MSEPLGTLHIGTAVFPVDFLKLSGGKLVVSGETVNPFPEGMKGAGWPTTYRLLDKDGNQVREGKLPAGSDYGQSLPRHKWRMTIDIDFESCEWCGHKL